MSILTPYLTAIKIATVVLILAATFWAGDQWAEGRHAKLDLVKEQAYTAAISQRVAANAAALKRQQADAASETATYQAKIAKLQRLNDKLTREAADASNTVYENGQKVSGPVSVSAGYVGLWNAKSQGRSCDELVPAPGVSAGQSACTDERSSVVTLGDLAVNHGQVSEICLGWKAQLDSIREWDDKRRARDGANH